MSLVGNAPVDSSLSSMQVEVTKGPPSIPQSLPSTPVSTRQSSLPPPPSTPPTVTRFIPYSQGQLPYNQAMNAAPGYNPYAAPYGTDQPYMSYPQTQQYMQQFIGANNNGSSNLGTPLPEDPNWLVYYVPDGTPYYYNKISGDTVWERPTAQQIEMARQTAEMNKAKDQMASVKAQAHAASVLDKTKPVSKTLIEGTNWSVVWTGDDRVFFFNVAEKRSVWNCPDELKGRKDVSHLIKRKPKIEGEERPIELLRDDAGVKRNSEDRHEERSGSKRLDDKERKVSHVRSTLPYTERVEQFRELLAEKNVSTTSTFEKELQKIVFDKRYTLLLSKERRQVFDQYVRDKSEEEKSERSRQHRKRKDDFRELLGGAGLNHRSSFSDFASKFSHDARFVAVERSRDRESMFYDMVSDLKHKRDRSEKSSRSKDFVELLRESSVSVKERWKDVKRRIDSDPRYKAVGSSDRREELFDEFMRSLESLPKECEEIKEEPIVANVSEPDKETKVQRLAEAVEVFKTLLEDLVKGSKLEFDEGMALMKDDSRWSSVVDLPRDDMKSLFSDHQKLISKKNKAVFYTLLAETSNIKLDSPWKEAKRLVRNDPRYSKFSSSDRKREKAFETFMREKVTKAKNDLRQLLKETITHKTSEKMDSGETRFCDIEDMLKSDGRYLDMECFPDQRRQIVEEHIAELSRKGSPPTQSVAVKK